MFPDLKTKALYLLIITIFVGHFWLVLYNLAGKYLQGQDLNSIEPIRYSLLAWLPFMLSIIYRSRKLSNLRKNVRSENLIEGGIKESQLHRDLTEIERNFLLQNYETTKDEKFYLDSRSPVFRIQGKVFVETLFEQDGRPHIALHVRNKTFTGDLTNIQSKLQEINDKEIVLEFSPKSQTIWKAYLPEEINTLQDGSNLALSQSTVRDLTQEEKKELGKNFRLEHYSLVFLFLFCLTIGYIMISQQLNSISQKGLKSENIYSIVFITIVVGVITVGNFLKNKSFFDGRSKVYSTSGRLSKTTQVLEKVFVVNGIVFSSQHNNKLVSSNFDKFSEGDKVIVEYSPRTKHVWKIYKTEDI